MQGPEKYLNELGISLPCAVDPTQSARLDGEHRVFVNYETYYLSSAAALKTFRASPYAYSGSLTDPVTWERFQPDGTSPRREHEGRTFFFAGQTSVADFDADPAAYATAMLTMQAEPHESAD